MARTRRYKLYGTGVGTVQDALTFAQFTRRGTIVGALFSQAFNSVTDNSMQYTEISLQPANQYTVNDSLGDIASTEYHVNGTAPHGQINVWVPLDVEVDEGERIYLNLYAAGTLASTNTVWVWVREP